MVPAMPTGGEFRILKKDILNSLWLWFGIHYIHNLTSEIWSQLFAVPMIVEAFWKKNINGRMLSYLYPSHRLFGCSVVRLFVYRLFGCSVVRLCVANFSFIRVRLFGYSCSFIRLFVSAVYLGVVLTVLKQDKIRYWQLKLWSMLYIHLLPFTLTLTFRFL